MKNLIMYKKGEHSFVLWIKKRIKNNLNFLAIAEGPTGIGKSWSMISIAHMIDNEFEPRQVAFSFKGVMEIINSDWFMKKKYRIIVFDEAQTDISNRQWQSLTNKLMNYLLSTFRHRNIILFFTSPYSDFIDIQSMKLMHCKFEIKGHSRKKKSTTIRPKLLQYNSRMKKFYEHSLYVIKNKRTHKMVTWEVPKPPKHLIEPYEEAKLEFTSKLNKSILAELENADKKDNGDKIDTRKPLTNQQREIIILYKKLGQVQLVAKEMGKDIGQVSRQLKAARNKGYRPENEEFEGI